MKPATSETQRLERLRVRRLKRQVKQRVQKLDNPRIDMSKADVRPLHRCPCGRMHRLKRLHCGPTCFQLYPEAKPCV